jgi:hypothetical protein
MSSFDHSDTSIDGEKLLFRSMNRVEGQVIGTFDDNDVHDSEDNIAIIMQLVVLFQAKYKMRPFVHGDDNTIAISQQIPYKDDFTDDDTIAIMQLVLYQDKYKTVRPFHLSTRAPATATTTVRRPLSSTVPDSASEYSVTSTNGEKLLLRSMYRVQDLVIGIFDGDDDDDDDDDGHNNNDTVHDNDDDTIAARQLEVLYQETSMCYHLTINTGTLIRQSMGS